MTDEMGELERALRDKIEKRDGLRMEAEATKEEWLMALGTFFSIIDTWIAPLEAKGLIKKQTVNYTMREESLGEYKAPGRVLLLADKNIEMKPIGRVIVGAIGRVDINSRLKQIPILRFKDGWKIAEQHKRMIYHDFDQGTFADLLKQLL